MIIAHERKISVHTNKLKCSLCQQPSPSPVRNSLLYFALYSEIIRFVVCWEVYMEVGEVFMHMCVCDQFVVCHLFLSVLVWSKDKFLFCWFVHYTNKDWYVDGKSVDSFASVHIYYAWWWILAIFSFVHELWPKLIEVLVFFFFSLSLQQ